MTKKRTGTIKDKRGRKLKVDIPDSVPNDDIVDFLRVREEAENPHHKPEDLFKK